MLPSPVDDEGSGNNDDLTYAVEVPSAFTVPGPCVRGVAGVL